MLREKLGIKVVAVTQPLGDDPNDPSAFLSESIHEVFDEYYSVSLSFWTRSGLREKARQGNLVGTLPWGYRRDPVTGGVVEDDERAELVRRMFSKYAEVHSSDRSLAVWLNAQGARTRKGNPFSKDTVREMMVNAAYAGFVTGRVYRDGAPVVVVEDGRTATVVPVDVRLWGGSRLPTSTEPVAIGSHAEPRQTTQKAREAAPNGGLPTLLRSMRADALEDLNGVSRGCPAGKLSGRQQPTTASDSTGSRKAGAAPRGVRRIESGPHETPHLL